MYLSEDSSSQHTVIDPRDANDPDYVPESSETPKVNVSTYLNINLDKLAPELERDGGGIESNARKFTKFMGILHEEGVVEQKYVIPRSKLESAIKRNGKRKLEELANRRPLGLRSFTFTYCYHTFNLLFDVTILLPLFRFYFVPNIDINSNEYLIIERSVEK